MLQLDNITFRHTSQAEVYRFTMALPAGKIATVHGNSGSGKSTLLDLIAGFLIPHSGNLLWQGRSFLHQRPQDRPITIVFQRNNLFEHRSALDNVLVGIDPSLPRQGTAYQKACTALKKVGLTNHLTQRVSTLSGGQQQRVAIARASIRNRGVVLLDEPFSALDQVTRLEMLDLVKQVAREQQSAMIMVTHDQRDADIIADHRYFLRDGKLRLLQ